ncbi:MAG TPA: hypothetical protein VLZ11_01780 [Flavobacterium sp.]|nr:hypothetical protein [Flavobacterium sp.]
MNKILLLVFLILVSSPLFSQENEAIQEIVQDSTGQVIMKYAAKTFTPSDATQVLDLFYQNHFEPEVIKALISERMFAITPYQKFKAMLQAKNTMCGAFVNKEIISEDFSENRLIVIYELKVEYQKTNTIEKVYLVKEDASDTFKVSKYLLQEDL